MSKARKSGTHRSGDPRKRGAASLWEQVIRNAQPDGVTDPRRLGGSIAGPGGPHDRGAVVIDSTDSILMDDMVVATVDAVRAGVLGEQAIYMTLSGRINKSTDRAKVGFLFGPDGAAALITELLAVADRFGAELLGDLTRRLTELHQGKNVDLHFLKAAIDLALESDESV